jgi:hypothetical protein
MVKITRALGAITLLALVGAVTVSPRAEPQAIVVGAATDRFPSETFEDWITFADFVAIASVVGEEEIPPPVEVLAEGEGYIGRKVDVNVDFENILWLRENNPDWFEEDEVVTWGWTLKEGAQLPFGIWGSPRLEVGQQYIIPFVLATDESGGLPEWTALSSVAAFPYDGEFITTEGIIGGVPTPLLEEAEGLTAQALASQLQLAASQSSLDTKYANLDPDARVMAVMRERGSTKP